MDFGLILLALFACAVTSILSDRLKISFLSYSKLLIIIGVLISIVHLVFQIPIREFTGEFFLTLVLPPLVFQAALTIDYEMFRKVQNIVLLLAIVGVAVSAIISSLILIVIGVPFFASLAFGVIISPTDAVAVIDTIKNLRPPKKLAMIIEGETLLNDATALALFSGVAALTLSPMTYAVDTVTKFVGGAVMGLVLGYLANKLMPILKKDAQVMITISISYGSFILAEEFHFSGIVAVAILGLYVGRFMQKTRSEAQHEHILGFWNEAAFLANSVAFIAIGWALNPFDIVRYSPLILFAFAAVLVARYVSVEALLTPLSRLIGSVPRSWRNVTTLAGVRGAVSAALALSLPPEFPYKNAIITVTFGVILLSLLVQTKLLSHYASKALA